MDGPKTVSLFYCFFGGAVHDSAQVFLLALCSEITPGGAQYVVQ